MSDSAEKLDLRKIKEAASAPAVPSAAEEVEEPKLVAREERFRVVYRDPEGKKYETALVSRIMNGDERQVVARMCALMSNGLPFDHLPGVEQARLYALAVCEVQLRDAPDWVSDWMKEDAGLLNGIFGQLEAHENRYFRRVAGPGEAATTFSTVEIDPIKST